MNKNLFLPKYRGSNIGVCLAPSGLVAVDVDLKNEGMEKWNRLIENHGDPKTLTATTGSGGRHYVFRAKPGISYRGKLDSGIDIRHNHLIVVEPSIHYHKKTKYKWDPTASPPL